MKQGACPKCASRVVYEIEEVRQADHDSSNATYAVTVAAHYGPTGDVGFFGDKHARAEVRVSAYVCASCAYTELYAKDLDVLAKLAASHAGGVRKVNR